VKGSWRQNDTPHTTPQDKPSSEEENCVSKCAIRQHETTLVSASAVAVAMVAAFHKGERRYTVLLMVVCGLEQVRYEGKCGL
jgi:hypothetical protein